MENTTVELLKALNEVYPKGIKFEALIKRNFDPKVIYDAWGQKIIVASYPIQVQSFEPLIFRTEAGRGDYEFWISVEGFQLLTLMHTNTSIRNLDTSIKKFNVSSDNLTKGVIILTIILVILTIVIAFK